MLDVSLLALYYFRELAEEPQMTKVAERLRISQSSLSRTISTLEQQMGVKLFARSGRNIVLTQEGLLVRRHVKRALSELDAMKLYFDSFSKGVEEHITVSVFAASKLLPKMLMEFQKAYPHIRLHVVQGHDASQNADLSIWSSMGPGETNHMTTLLQEDFKLAIPRSHPLAQESAVILSDFAGDDFICLQQGTDFRRVTDYICSAAGFAPRIILEGDSLYTVREFVQAGTGISIIPSHTWPEISDENIALVPISSPQCHRYIILSRPLDIELSPAATLLREHLVNAFKKLSEGK